MKMSREKFIKSFFLFGPTELDRKKIKTIAKYKTVNKCSNYDKDVDDNAVALLCLPDGIKQRSVDEEIKRQFHSFLITKENGLRVYGSALIVYDKIYDEQTKQSSYFSKALCLVTELPFIHCTERILNYIWIHKCSIELIKLICNLNLPTQGRSVCLKLPESVSNDATLDYQPFRRKSSLTNENRFKEFRYNEQGKNDVRAKDEQIDLNVYIYAGTKNLPLFDYSLRYLFTEVLSVENFLIAFTATLLEYQILITSTSLSKLMLVSESLINLMHPFKWQQVYVPILPSKLGLHYLDAPTPFIMGVLNYDEKFQSLNSSSGTFSLSNSIRCKIDCDLNFVEFYAEEGSIDITSNELDLSDQSEDEDLKIDEKNKYTFTVPKFVSELQEEIENFIHSDLRLKEHLNRNQAIGRITKLAFKHNVINKFSYVDEIKFNHSIRQMFLNKLNSNILSNYERYVVMSKKDTVKFDSTSFLSEQPVIIRNFLSKFLKTQLFASYIDESARKLAQNLSISTNNELCIVDTDNLVDEIDEQFGCDLNFNLDEVFNNSQIIDLNSLVRKNSQSSNSFDANEDHKYPNVQHSNLKQLNSPFKVYSPVHTNKQSGNRKNSLASNNSPYMRDDNERFVNNYLDQLDVQYAADQTMINSPMRIQTEKFATQTNYHVVENLLKEVKNKTKKILLEKMADEDPNTGTINSTNDLEENTLIASLCDLIERIWTHAKCSETSHSKCAFWVHISAYYRISTSSEEIAAQKVLRQQNENMSPVLAWVKKKIDYIGSQNEYSKNKSFFSSSSPNHQTIKKKLSNPSLNSIKCTPSTMFYDYETINNMSDIKTEIGKSRAFVRLALERKLLSKHLRTLLSNQQLTCAFYKRYAFLRCEDEKEQFLTHLLTLNAVDLLPFTNTFITSTFKYKLILYGSSSFTGYFSLSGSLFELNDQYISSSTSVHTFECRNLGLVNNLTLRVTGNNKIYLEYCYIINDFTGQTYRFQCNRWLGKNIDDGACEFIVNSEQISNEKAIEHLKKSLLAKGSSIGRQLTKAFDNERTEIIQPDELKDLLGKSINLITRLYGCSPLPRNLIRGDLSIDMKQMDKKYSNNLMIKKLNNKFFDLNGQDSHKSKLSTINQLQSPLKTLKVKHQQELNKPNRANMLKLQQSLIRLLFGERQLIWVLNEIFYYDFKNKRKSSFKKQQFVWDFVLCIQLELKLLLKERSLINQTNQSIIEPQAILTKDEDDLKLHYIELVDKISSKAPLIGKDGKFQLFLLISLREHLLSKFIEFMENQSLASLYYGSNAFLVDSNKSNFLKQILSPLNEINFILDQSFTKGL